MNQGPYKFTFLFALVLVCNVSIEAGFIDIPRTLPKLLICFSLAAYFFRQTGAASAFDRLILCALTFSFAGDWLLLYESYNPVFFLTGLLAFLAAHICYATAFYFDSRARPAQSRRFGHVLIFLTGGFSVVYYRILEKSLGGMKMPVLAYILCISLMTILSGYRYLRVNAASFWFILSGALLFMASDSLLAWNKFIGTYPGSVISITVTYALAQFMITTGAVMRKRAED